MEGVMALDNRFSQLSHRIKGYMSILQICITFFEEDTRQCVSEKDLAYITKIQDALTKLDTLITGIMDSPNEALTSDRLAKCRHDARLSVDIIQGYSDIIVENCQASHQLEVAGHFSVMMVVAGHLLHNTDLLK